MSLLVACAPAISISAAFKPFKNLSLSSLGSFPKFGRGFGIHLRYSFYDPRRSHQFFPRSRSPGPFAFSWYWRFSRLLPSVILFPAPVSHFPVSTPGFFRFAQDPVRGFVRQALPYKEEFRSHLLDIRRLYYRRIGWDIWRINELAMRGDERT